MEYRPLGRSGLKVSVLGLGTMTWGEQNTEAEAHAQMDYALEQGINLFDTAEVYPIPPRKETQGATERIIGNWFKSRPGARDKIVLASKVAGRGGQNWLRDSGAGTELSPAQIEEAVNKSLQRLQTDRIDLYQLHWPDRPVSQMGMDGTIYRHREDPSSHPIGEILDALDKIVRAGKVRFIGLANETPWGTMSFLQHSALKGAPRVQSNQNAYSLLNRTFEMGLAEIAMRENVGLIAYSPLGQGFLTGKYQGGAVPPGSRKQLYQRGARYETPQAPKAIERYLTLAKTGGLDAAQMALAFCITRPFLTSVLVGASKMEQLRNNIAAKDVRLSVDVLNAINAIHTVLPNPCP